jgi:hypothetical protein
MQAGASSSPVPGGQLLGCGGTIASTPCTVHSEAGDYRLAWALAGGRSGSQKVGSSVAEGSDGLMAGSRRRRRRQPASMQGRRSSPAQCQEASRARARVCVPTCRVPPGWCWPCWRKLQYY